MKRWWAAVTGMALVAALGFVVASADEAKEPAGKALFLSYKCNSCHSIEAAGVAKKASAEGEEETASTSKKKSPDLSGVGLKAKADWIAKFLMKQETTKEGKKHMKLFKGTDEELKTVSAWLETMKTEKAGKAESAEKASEKTETEKAPEKAEGAETK